VTDTDLIAAGSGAEEPDLRTAATAETAEVSNTQADVEVHAAQDPTAKGDGALATMVLPELRALANEVGVKGTSGMRKNELIAAIRERRGEPISKLRNGGGNKTSDTIGTADTNGTADTTGTADTIRTAGVGDAPPKDADQTDSGESSDTPSGGDQVQGGDQQGGQNRGDDDGEGRQGRRGRRFRDRRRRERGGEGTGEAELREDDVVQPVAGILDVLDNYAFVRTSGYLAGPNDVYVSMNMVRKNGLRRGDHITGAVRLPREGDGGNQNPRQKFNPLVRIDGVNGGSVEDAKKRPDFGKLTPLYPNQRLRLETATERLTTRVIDLIMPIGKGQRALIVSPPKAGKTTILQDIANAITRNNPECHLMVVLVDERPEEVTDMQRSVKGEVIASTFDRPPSDHTSVAELAIERAKRLVEQGRDVVVLLDSITRLGRAYNNASPASGRILSGGVDSTALYPPKRFLGAARNIEEGGSLTIVATAMVETGSTGDTVIFEEFKGTGNAELKLDRKIAERRVFPAVDVNPSGTRKDELLLSPDEFAIVHKLRRVLSGLDSHQAIDLLMSQLRKTKTNYEFLVQVSKNAPGPVNEEFAS
jgi:transcription termination factor Rho